MLKNKERHVVALRALKKYRSNKSKNKPDWIATRFKINIVARKCIIQ